MREIEENLNEMIQLFVDDNWDSWANFFRTALSYFQEGDLVKCGQHISSGSGGMGSLNDVVLGQEQDSNGQFRWKTNYKESNRRYSELLAKLYGFAQDTKRIK